MARGIRSNWLAVAALATTLVPGLAISAPNQVRIGVLTDMTGPFAGFSGPGSLAAAQMAVEDLAATLPFKVEVVGADHANKPDNAAAIAGRWFDVDGVDVVVDVPNSAAVLAVSEVVRQKNRTLLISGSSSSDLYGKACSPNNVMWTYDSYTVANAIGTAVTRNGGDSWFILMVDFTAGKALARDLQAAVEKNNGRVLGVVPTPLNGLDFASFVLQAQSSKAKIIGLAEGGGDLVKIIKQGAEFNVVGGGQAFATPVFFITDLHALGLEVAHGLRYPGSFYWNMNDETRAFSARFAKRANGAMPTDVQAGVYSSVQHYLRGVVATGSTDGDKVVAWMKQVPADDKLLGKGPIRADGRKVSDVYIFEAKAPKESRGPWDYVNIIGKLSGDEAIRPLADGGCPLVK